MRPAGENEGKAGVDADLSRQMYERFRALASRSSDLLLTDCGSNVIAFSNAAEAIGNLKRTPPDVLISDVGMPGMDGCQFIQEVRELDSPDLHVMPAIALTAFARSEDRTGAMMAGCDMHVAKTIESQELLATVANLAARRTKRR